MSILPQGYANSLTPVFETNQTPDSINVITTSGLAVATRVGNTVNINVPAIGTENLADTLIAGNSAGANQINMNSNKIINCLNPVSAQDVATKAYVDAYSPAADSLASVLAISNIVGATGINMNNTQRVYNCINPVSAQDVATKFYVDSLVAPTPTLKAVMNVGNIAGTTLNMDGYDIGNAGSITAGGITEAINFGTLITPMLGNNQYATSVSINGINPLATATSITGVGGVSISSSLGDVSISCPLNKDLGISGGDINITQIDPASVLNISSTGAMALVSGIGLDISATAAVLINSSGNISIGSGNALGADVEVEKIAFKENKIYKAITVPIPADIQIEDVASIVNVGDPIAINGSITNISAQANGNVNISATGTGAVAVSAPTATITTSGNISLTTTGGTADITLTAEDAITATCKGAFTAGSTLGLTTISGATTNITAVPNGTVNLITTGSGNVVVNSQNFFTAVSKNFDLSNETLTLNSITATGQTAPILKLVNTNTTGGTTNPVVIQTVKNDSSPTAGDVIAEITARGTINTGALQDYTRIQSIAQNIGGTSAGIDGTMNLQCITNGAYNTYLTLNGSSQQINAGKALLMNNNDITGIKDVGLQTGALGLVGQSLVSGQGTGSKWNYNMASVSIAGNGGANTLNAGSFSDIAGGLAIPLTASGFVASPINKYKVSAWGTFSGVNDSVRMYMTIQANGTGAIATGDTFNAGSDLYYYTQDINFGGGSHFTTFSFSDIFTCALNIGGTATVNLLVECGSGSHTIANNRHQFSLEPIFTP